MAAYARNGNLLDEAQTRRSRATAFLRAMWVGFGKKKEIDMHTWQELVRFVKKTNDACHASASWGSAKHASNVVSEQRSNPPRVNAASAGATMTKLLVMIDIFGGQKWTHASAKASAVDNRALFRSFPESWVPRTA